MFVAILEEIDWGLSFQALQTQTHFWAEGGPKRILLLKAQNLYFSRTLYLVYYSLYYKVKHQFHQVFTNKIRTNLDKCAWNRCCNLFSVWTQMWSNSLEQFFIRFLAKKGFNFQYFQKYLTCIHTDPVNMFKGNVVEVGRSLSSKVVLLSSVVYKQMENVV